MVPLAHYKAKNQTEIRVGIALAVLGAFFCEKDNSAFNSSTFNKISSVSNQHMNRRAHKNKVNKEQK